MFYTNPKNVYREFRKDGKVNVENASPKEEVKQFLENIWSKKRTYNENNTWTGDVRNNYCKTVITHIKEIRFEQFVKVNENLKDNTSPGLDQTTGFWIKQSRSTRDTTFNVFKKISSGEDRLPEWIAKARTTLVAKTKDSHNPKNYRAIACENVLLKTYTGTIVQLIEEHLTENSIICSEQAGAKKGSWGCIDQLMINKVVTDEVAKGRRNLSMMWLDCKKVYDSVPHAWILESLRLAKIPQNIIQAIEQLISSWKTELNIPTVDGNITIGDVIYEKGVLQGDYLSIILFILSLNPLSYLLNTRTKGIKMEFGSAWQQMLSHLFSVDDLKPFASGIEESKVQLAIVIEFSRDIGMSFGEDKCGYICIEHGKRKSQGKSIVINGVNTKELEEGESYRYLGQDEAIGYEGKLNKERVTKE